MKSENVDFGLFVPHRELKHGIPVTDENDNRLGESTKAAQQAISQVVISRILMASPGMGQHLLFHFWIEIVLSHTSPMMKRVNA